jgi:hypothetical protein
VATLTANSEPDEGKFSCPVLRGVTAMYFSAQIICQYQDPFRAWLVKVTNAINQRNNAAKQNRLTQGFVAAD